MNDINIKETIRDKKTWFNIKRFTFKGLGTPSVKTIDSNNLTKEMFDELDGFKHNNFIFEKSKNLKFDSIKNILDEYDNTKIGSHFGHKKWLDNNFSILNMTLQFNPYTYISNINEIDAYFTYYHKYSDLIFVPNIRKHRTDMMTLPDGKKRKQTTEIISLADYMRFIDETYDLLSSKNKKHIFVPISLKFTANEIKELIEHYLKKEWFYFWFDFEAKPLISPITARIDIVNKLVEKAGYFDKSLMFFTNMKREMISKRKDEKSPASDVLGTGHGANVIGVNREPQMNIELKNMQKYSNLDKKNIFMHKARKFDNASYYYVKTSDQNFLSKNKNITNNSLNLSSEFDNQTNYFFTNLEISGYLSKKEMIKDYKKGSILKDMEKNKPEISLF